MAKERGTNGYNGGPTVGQKMLAMLQDGMPHTVAELKGCMWDEEGLDESVRPRIADLRKHLRPQGYDIIHVQARVSEDGQAYYRMIRLLASAVDGKR